MKTDSKCEYLLAGDTTGTIAVFDIKTYCNTEEVNKCKMTIMSSLHHCYITTQEGGDLEPVARWRGHSKEVVSIDYVPHGTGPLILSASGDGTVRLWTLFGHFIGTFGQENSWNLDSPASFQHPKYLPCCLVTIVTLLTWLHRCHAYHIFFLIGHLGEK